MSCHLLVHIVFIVLSFTLCVLVLYIFAIFKLPSSMECLQWFMTYSDLQYRGMVVQWVALLLRSPQTPYSVMSVDYCLCRVFHVLLTSAWVSSNMSSYLINMLIVGLGMLNFPYLWMSLCSWCTVMDWHHILGFIPALLTNIFCWDNITFFYDSFL